MDNPIKGETSFDVDGETFTLVFSNNAFIALEDHLDRGILDIYEELDSWSPKRDAKGKPLPETPAQTLARVKRIRMGFCRAVFWAGLTERHPGITIDRVDDLMIKVGGLAGVMNLIAKGVSRAQPTENESDGTARPLKGARKRRGTGSAS